MKSMRIVGVGLAMMCALLLAACAQATPKETKQEPETVSEGVDTPIAVAYEGHTATAGYFPVEGDSIAVIAPSALPSQKQVDAVVKGLTDWGYVPVQGKHVTQKDRTLDDCVADLVWALEDPSIKAIFCVRGGYGVSEVADELPEGLIAQAKKPIIGYSDISVLHSAWTSAGLPSVHACMSGTFDDSFPAECVEAEQRMIKGETPTYTCKSSGIDKAGHAEGILIGGNLSTFTSVLGTAYDCTKIDEPYILFLEDVGEDVQHVHRYLAILKHLGVLDRASGIIFGEWTDVPTDMDDYDGSSRGGTFAGMTDMIARQYIPNLDVPVACGFPAGHGDTNYPLLLGSKATLDIADGSFTLSWAAGE